MKKWSIILLISGAAALSLSLLIIKVFSQATLRQQPGQQNQTTSCTFLHPCNPSPK